jgi:hypothetical protein
MLCSHELQIIDSDQIKHVAAHCVLPGPRSFHPNRRTGGWLHEPLSRLPIHGLEGLDADPAGGQLPSTVVPTHA